MRRLRLLLWIGVLLVALALGWLARRPAPAMAPGTVTSRPDPDARATIGGPFTLVDGKGQPFASSRLAGRPFAIFFGFTHCPDVCPTTLSRLVRLRRAAGIDAGQLPIVFVTVDPARDGPAEVAAYANLFGAPVIGLTGSPAQVDAARRAYGITAQKVGAGDDYSVDHTATAFLMGRDGQLVATIAPDEGDGPARDKLARAAR